MIILKRHRRGWSHKKERKNDLGEYPGGGRNIIQPVLYRSTAQDAVRADGSPGPSSHRGMCIRVFYAAEAGYALSVL